MASLMAFTYSTAHAELKRESAVPRESRALDSQGRGLEHEYSSARGREGLSSHTSGSGPRAVRYANVTT